LDTAEKTEGLVEQGSKRAPGVVLGVEGKDKQDIYGRTTTVKISLDKKMAAR